MPQPTPRQALWKMLESQPWDTFATLTYRPHRQLADGTIVPFTPTIATARRSTEHLLRRIGADRAYWVTERGSKFGRVHNHALIQHGTLFDTDDRTDWWQWWRENRGRAEFMRYDPAKGAAHYLSSYLTKSLCDWDLWLPSNNSSIKRSRSRKRRRPNTDSTTTQPSDTESLWPSIALPVAANHRESFRVDDPSLRLYSYSTDTEQGIPASPIRQPGNRGTSQDEQST